MSVFFNSRLLGLSCSDKVIRVSVFIYLVLGKFRMKIKIKSCEIFSHILQHSQNKFVPRASRFSCLFLAIACTIDVILLDFPDVFHIWPTLAVNTQLLMERLTAIHLVPRVLSYPPWKTLVACLPESGRLQTNDLGERQVSVSFVSKERRNCVPDLILNAENNAENPRGGGGYFLTRG